MPHKTYSEVGTAHKQRLWVFDADRSIAWGRETSGGKTGPGTEGASKLDRRSNLAACLWLLPKPFQGAKVVCFKQQKQCPPSLTVCVYLQMKTEGRTAQRQWQWGQEPGGHAGGLQQLVLRLVLASWASPSPGADTLETMLGEQESCQV